TCPRTTSSSSLCFVSFILGQAFNTFCASLSAGTLLKTESIRVVNAGSDFSFKALLMVVGSVLVIHDVLVILPTTKRTFKALLAAADGAHIVQVINHLTLVVSTPLRVNGPAAIRAQRVGKRWIVISLPRPFWLISLLAPPSLAIVHTVLPVLESSTALVLFAIRASPVPFPAARRHSALLQEAPRRAQYSAIQLNLLPLLAIAAATRVCQPDMVDKICYATIQEVLDTTDSSLEAASIEKQVVLQEAPRPGPHFHLPPLRLFLAVVASSTRHLEIDDEVCFASIEEVPDTTESFIEVASIKAEKFYSTPLVPARGRLALPRWIPSCNPHLLRLLLSAASRTPQRKIAAEVQGISDTLVVEAVSDSSSIKEEIDTDTEDVVAEVEETFVTEDASEASRLAETLADVEDTTDTLIVEAACTSSDSEEKKVEAVTVALERAPTYEEFEWDCAPSYEEFAGGAPPEPLFEKRPASVPFRPRGPH
ncbi:hypothetical protein DFH09DRAFT_1182525, partial [Mycena vulgaris]